MPDEHPEDMVVTGNTFNQWHQEFMQMCAERHHEGAEKYGPIAFLGNDMLQFMAEELADIVNYATYTYLKLRFMMEVLDEGGIDQSSFSVAGHAPDRVPPGTSSFASVEDVLRVDGKRSGS